MSKTEREAITLLSYLIENPSPEGGIKEVARATGISYTECYRYLNEESWEGFTLPQIESMRRYRRQMYLHVIETAQYREDGRIWLNRSKHPMLLAYAHKHGFRVRPSFDFPGFTVEKERSDGLYFDQIGAHDPNAILRYDSVSHTEF